MLTNETINEMEALEFLRIARNICNRQKTCSECPLRNTMPGCFEIGKATDVEQNTMLARVQEVADMYGTTPTDDTDNALEAIRRDMTGMEMRITELTEAVAQMRLDMAVVSENQRKAKARMMWEEVDG